MDWWFCLKHMRAEKGADCKGEDRMGPYADEQAAANALQTARERTAKRDAEDAAEDDW